MTPVISLEKELIGACLWSPDASLEALGVRPDFFIDTSYAAIWSYIADAGGNYSVASIIADVSGLGNTKDRVIDAYSDCPGGDFHATVKRAADKITEDFKRRQGRLVLNWMQNALDQGREYESVMAEYRQRLDDLATVGTTKTRFRPIAVDDMAVPVTQWLIKGIMPTTGLGFIAGAEGAGKSFLMLHTALSLATGRDGVFGRRCRRTAVVYVAAEDFTGCQIRVKAWALRHPSDLPPMFEMIEGPVNLLDAQCVEELVRAINTVVLKYAIEGVAVGLVVFDTLAKCIPGADENNSPEMSRAIQALDDIGRRTGAFVTAVAHYGKSGGAGGIRGWSGLSGASDMTITVERQDDDPNVRVVTFKKVKQSTDGAQLYFTLDRVGLGIHDDMGGEVDSAVCIFETPEPRSRAKDKPLTPALELMMAAIKWCVDHGQTYPIPADMHAPLWSRAVAFLDVRERAVRTGFMPGAKQDKDVNRALEYLAGLGKIGRDLTEDRLWLR